MQYVLPDFFATRERLIGELQRTAHAVDEWWAARASTAPTLHDLAMLEGMLAERKTLLERMVQLDDDMLGQLIKARGQAVDDGA